MEAMLLAVMPMSSHSCRQRRSGHQSDQIAQYCHCGMVRVLWEERKWSDDGWI
jgi:hypothetical protein